MFCVYHIWPGQLSSGVVNALVSCGEGLDLAVEMGKLTSGTGSSAQI